MIQSRFTTNCILVFLFSLALASPMVAQQTDYDISPKKSKAIYFLDSVLITSDQLAKVLPSDVATINKVNGQAAIKILGNKAKDGIIYIETKKFARKRYWNYLKSKDPNYVTAVPNPENESLVQYVLDSRVLKKDYERYLSSLNDSNFKSIEIIPQDSLLKRYGIYRKKYGVIIERK